MPSVVMTLIGEDRPGLVGRVADVVAQHDGNWLESRMAHLGGQFAGILRVDVSADNLPTLVVALQGLQTEGLRLLVEPTDVQEPNDAEIPAHLECVGGDRPGIVAEISRALAERSANVEDLATECSSAAMSGKPIFRVHGTIRIPADVNVAELREHLEQIGHDLMVDLSLKADG